MRSPEQQFAFAKTLPIPELAKVLQGQSDVVDMAIAQMVLREKTRAQKMQQGVAAQQMAQQPKVAEKDLMEAGIAAAPVDVNVPQGGIVGSDGQMSSTGAGGGIVAFADGGLTWDSIFGDSQRPMPLRYTNDPSKPVVRKPSDMTPEEVEQAKKMGLWDALKATYGPTFSAIYDSIASGNTLRKDIQASTSPTPGYAPGDVRRGDVSETASVPVPAAPAVETPAAKAATTASPEDAGIAALGSQIKGLRSQLVKPDMKTSAQEMAALYKEAGVSMDPYEQYKKDLEKEATEDAAARKEAGWMRALEAGLGIMGGESPYALTNIGKGSEAAVKGYASDIKEFRKAAKDRNRALADIAVAENNLKKGITDAKVARYDRAMEKYDAANLKLYEIDATLSMEKAKLAVAKGAKVTEVALKEANDQIQKELSLNPTLASDPTAYQARLSELYSTFVSALQGKGATGSVPSGVKVTPKNKG